MTVDSTLLVIAPEFASLAEADRQAVIDLAALSVGSIFGDKQDLATAYLAAHMLTMSQRTGGAAGPLKSEKEGDLSRSYGGRESNDPYDATGYGQEFKRIQKQVVFSARTRTV